MLGIRLLIDDGVDVGGVTLLVTADEEIGSPTSRELIESEAAGCSATFVLEASGPGGALKTERKGTSNYYVNIIGRAAHAGLEPEKGINAGVELAHQVLAINELGDPDLGTTVTPTVLSAGTTTNTVPARAQICVDVRVRTAEEQQRIDDEFGRLQSRLPGAVLDIDGGPNRPPLQASASMELFRRAQQLAAASGLDPLESVAVGGASDGNFTAGIGVPTLDGLGAVGGGAHADDEHVLADKIPGRTALLAILIKDQLAAIRHRPGLDGCRQG
jgi:glutamate carboxypeptidase